MLSELTAPLWRHGDHAWRSSAWGARIGPGRPFMSRVTVAALAVAAGGLWLQSSVLDSRWLAAAGPAGLAMFVAVAPCLALVFNGPALALLEAGADSASEG